MKPRFQKLIQFASPATACDGTAVPGNRLFTRVLVTWALLLLLLGPAAHACNVPVFRYALEHWPAGNFQVFVFTDGGLGSPDQQRVEAWKELARQTHANVQFTTVQMNRASDRDRELCSAETNAVLPWAVVLAPETDTNVPPVWRGRLAELDATRLIDSPARRVMAQRLAGGDSAVWVLLESGDSAVDNAAATLLTNELKRLETALKLPPPAEDDPAPRSNLPLKIAFSILRLSRSAPGENYFVRMLLHDEELPAGKPVVYPVFGRGRALAALAGADISAKTFSQAAAFLCGACSCEVKELNPGKDLLVAHNWEALLTGPAEEPKGTTPGVLVPIAPGNASLEQTAGQHLETAAAPRTPKANPRRGTTLLASTALAFFAILLLLAGIALLRAMRQR